MNFNRSDIPPWIKNNQYQVALAIAFVVAFIPLFYRLDAHPVFLWDESRQAANMMGMIESGNPFITYFEGRVDHYNTKPPLLIWLQVLFMLLTDNGELALRLPSALAALGICFGLVWFFKAYINKPIWGAFAAFILVSTSGFIELHGSRTGDYDALIALWIFLSVAQYLLFLKNNQAKNLYLFYLFFALGIATKGPVPLMTLPILFIWTLFSSKLKTTLSNLAFYKGMVIPLFFILIFYGIRIITDPDYWSNTWYNDFGGRYAGIIDGHSEPFNYYWLKLISERAKYFFVLLPLSLMVLIGKNSTLKMLALFSFSFVALWLLTISIAKTRIYWYDTPLLPFIAINIACSLLFIFDQFYLRKKAGFGWVLVSSAIILILAVPYQSNLVKVIKNDSFSWEGDEFYEPSKLFKRAIHGEINLAEHVLLYDTEYMPHYHFYMNRLHHKQGYKINTIKLLSEVKSGDKVIYFQPHSYGDSLKYYEPKSIIKVNDFIQILEY